VRSRLRRFAAVGVLVTVVDVAVLFALRLGFGLPVLVADAIAIAAGGLVSFVANRALTFTRDPHLRWVDEPFAYLIVTAAAGVIDVLVLRLAYVLFELWWKPASYGAWVVSAFGRHATVRDYEPRWLIVGKVIALGVAGVVRLIGYRGLLFRRVRAAQLQPEPNRTPAPGLRRVSVVVPAYKASSFIAESVARLRAELGPLVGGDLEIVVVDDGSPDDTFAAAQASDADAVLRLDENQGKGAAVRRGMLAATGRTIAFTDADLAYSPALVFELIREVEAGWDVVVGSRSHVETVTLVRARRLRALGSRVINMISFAVLLGAYRDTQCGLKAFRSDAAHEIFSVARINRFAFDIEVFHLAERMRLSLKEVPVTLANTEASTVKMGLDSVRVLVDMVRIRRLAGKGAYDRAK
jgi:dolichyl-phosphate beta-glucosyltransferase